MALLKEAFELLAVAVNASEVVVSKLTPLLLGLAAELLSSCLRCDPNSLM
jgi:hypothetical protein